MGDAVAGFPLGLFPAAGCPGFAEVKELLGSSRHCVALICLHPRSGEAWPPARPCDSGGATAGPERRACLPAAAGPDASLPRRPRCSLRGGEEREGKASKASSERPF